MRVHVVDPPAYTPPYDHALCSALSAAGAQVELFTSRFGYAAVPPPAGYTRHEEAFYRHAPGRPGSTLRRATRLLQHAGDMRRYARAEAPTADVVHLQWLAVPQLDGALLPRGMPLVLTAHDVMPREPQPGQLARWRSLLRRMDAVVVHSEHGRRRLVDEGGVGQDRVRVIPHGAFTHLTSVPGERPLPPELDEVEVPVVLCFGLIRPYKGVDVLLEAWRGVQDAELWIVGLPRLDLEPLRASAPSSVRFVDRFVADDEVAAFFRRADLVVLPYREIDQSGVLFTALAFGAPLLLTEVGGFPEIAAAGAARLVAPGDPEALAAALRDLLTDDDQRDRLAAGARALAAGRCSWDQVARAHLDLYAEVAA
jgi:glycosyltransferase involved in cell wall biosynthesis